MEKKINKIIEVVIWLAFIIILNIVSYFLETKGLNMPKWVALVLRISTVIMDAFFVLYIRKLRIYYRRVFKGNFPKKTKSVFWLADLTTVLLIFYLSYVLKITLLLFVKVISLDVFLSALSGALLIGLVFGGFMPAYIKKYSKKISLKLKKGALVIIKKVSKSDT